ncbi:MAG: hypothetical protein HDT47_06420 [Ruminococcaceae bacterium]|nr:hypothetical protein [Oscillospiraceae bacterium]
MNTFYVSIDVESAAIAINKEVVDGSITGELIDFYEVKEEKGSLVVLVFEKHYWRAGNRLTLTVTIDDLCGKTRVHYVSGGGGEGLFRFDWGAAESFEGVAEDALRNYIIP